MVKVKEKIKKMRELRRRKFKTKFGSYEII